MALFVPYQSLPDIGDEGEHSRDQIKDAFPNFLVGAEEISHLRKPLRGVKMRTHVAGPSTYYGNEGCTTEVCQGFGEEKRRFGNSHRESD